MRPSSWSVPVIVLLLVGLPYPTASCAGANLALRMTNSGYLDGPGVSVMLYDDNYSPIFFDQKDAAMQIILHGHRIATNGSVRLLPTPEQWDVIPHLIERKADKAHDRLTAFVSYPAYHFYYHVVVAAEPGGLRVSVNLDKPLPKTLVGRAGFNLELLPSIYSDKAYSVDDEEFGVFPRSPEARIITAAPR